MTRAPHGESAFERVLAVVMIAVFWTAFTCLAAGLGLWLLPGGADTGAQVLRAGVIVLLSLPALRLASVIVTAARDRDGLTVAATVVVLLILAALTLRDTLN